MDYNSYPFVDSNLGRRSRIGRCTKDERGKDGGRWPAAGSSECSLDFAKYATVHHFRRDSNQIKARSEWNPPRWSRKVRRGQRGWHDDEKPWRAAGLGGGGVVGIERIKGRDEGLAAGESIAGIIL